jgi:hypothetical protein
LIRPPLVERLTMNPMCGRPRTVTRTGSETLVRLDRRLSLA